MPGASPSPTTCRARSGDRARRQQGVKSKEELAAEQAAYWKGAGGDDVAGRPYERIQRGIAGFSEIALEAADAQPGERVLDVGCGTGGTTADLATAVGAGGHVLGVDISEPLVEALARGERSAMRRFEVADAATHRVRGGVVRPRLLALRRDVLRRSRGRVPEYPPCAEARRAGWSSCAGARRRRIPGAGADARGPAVPAADGAARAGGSRAVFLRRSRAGRAHPAARRASRACRSSRSTRPMSLGKDIAGRAADASADFGPLARAFEDVAPEQIAKAKAAIAAGAEAACDGGGRQARPAPAGWCAPAPDGAHSGLFRCRRSAWCWAAPARARARMPRGWSPARLSWRGAAARRLYRHGARRATSRWRRASWPTAPAAAANWTTIEEPLKLDEALESAAAAGPAGAGRLPDAVALEPDAWPAATSTRRPTICVRTLDELAVAGGVRQQRGRARHRARTRRSAARSATRRAGSTCAWPSAPIGSS